MRGLWVLPVVCVCSPTRAFLIRGYALAAGHPASAAKAWERRTPIADDLSLSPDPRIWGRRIVSQEPTSSLHSQPGPLSTAPVTRLRRAGRRPGVRDSWRQPAAEAAGPPYGSAPPRPGTGDGTGSPGGPRSGSGSRLSGSAARPARGDHAWAPPKGAPSCTG